MDDEFAWLVGMPLDGSSPPLYAYWPPGNLTEFSLVLRELRANYPALLAVPRSWRVVSRPFSPSPDPVAG